MGLFTRSKARANGNLTSESQLRDSGITELGNSFIELNKAKYRQMLEEQDFIETTSRYKWENLPSEIDGWIIENMLYYKGSLCMYFQGGTLKVLPYANSGNINIYGMPTKINSVSYNGESNIDLDLPVNYYGNYNSKGMGAVLLFDRTTRFKNGKPIPRDQINNVLLDDMAGILARVKNNVLNSDKKIVYYVENEAQKNAFYKTIKSCYDTDDPFIVVVKNSLENGGIQNEPFHTQVDLQAQALIETYQSLNNIRCQVAGINAGEPFLKKERKLNEEMSGNENQTFLTLDNGLEMRKLALKQLASVYPMYKNKIDKIKVSIREKEGDEEIKEDSDENKGYRF